MERLFVIMVGIPGSGKTWALERLFPNAHVIRPDDYIGYTKEQPWTPQAARFAWDRAHDDMKKSIGADGPEIIAFDATMVSDLKRARYINSAKKAGRHAVAVFLTTPKGTCLVRNASRDQARQVPPATIASMEGRLVPPRLEEGFAAIMRFDGQKAELECKFEIEAVRQAFGLLEKAAEPST